MNGLGTHLMKGGNQLRGTAGEHMPSLKRGLNDISLINLHEHTSIYSKQKMGREGATDDTEATSIHNCICIIASPCLKLKHIEIYSTKYLN
jgi:hypothetical protein